VPSNLIPIAALTQSIENNYSAALKIERKMSHLNVAFDRYASIGTVMHYILVISVLIDHFYMVLVSDHCI